MVLQGRNILLGITGGIAAFKAPLILRELIRSGADVRVVMTQAGQQFVTPTTLEVLSKHPVRIDMFARADEFPVLHVGLAQWADLVLIAPATANIIGKIAAGLGDDLLSTLMLSFPGPVVVAPAMEENMLLNPFVQRNIKCLRERGVLWVEPEVGELASGAMGRGRLAEPDAIIEAVVGHFAQQGDLKGLRLLVTAGPTVEDIDPVRFIANRSTGKMGYALARRARERGARVCLVSGPAALPPPAGVELIQVRSTLQMQAAVEERFDEVDGAILAAAVSDYRVPEVALEKIKRGEGARVLELVENPDIAAGLGQRKEGQVLVGFAVETGETEAGVERAREKLRRKNLDLIALNNLRDEGAGFAVDTNVVTLIDASGQVQELGKMSKLEVADRILDRVAQLGRERT